MLVGHAGQVPLHWRAGCAPYREKRLFRETLDMPDEDYEFIEHAYDALTDEEQDEIPADDI